MLSTRTFDRIAKLAIFGVPTVYLAIAGSVAIAVAVGIVALVLMGTSK